MHPYAYNKIINVYLSALAYQLVNQYVKVPLRILIIPDVDLTFKESWFNLYVLASFTSVFPESLKLLIGTTYSCLE